MNAAAEAEFNILLATDSYKVSLPGGEVGEVLARAPEQLRSSVCCSGAADARLAPVAVLDSPIPLRRARFQTPSHLVTARAPCPWV
ncbi:hypothetical protein H8959_008199 [Pygathrix nigripes]